MTGHLKDLELNNANVGKARISPLLEMKSPLIFKNVVDLSTSDIKSIE